MAGPSELGAISGAVAGLATVTQGAGFVEPFAGMLFGLCGGLICFWMVSVAKNRFGYDDSLDAFGVHGIGGLIGCTLTGFLATNRVNDALKLSSGLPAPLGLIDGNGGQVVNQLIGAGVGIALAIAGTFVALKLTGLITPLRIDQRDEREGMDQIIHGEEGYSFDS